MAEAIKAIGGTSGLQLYPVWLFWCLRYRPLLVGSGLLKEKVQSELYSPTGKAFFLTPGHTLGKGDSA
jgi:hypothetical protein